VIMFVNGVRRGPVVLEDSQQPSSEVVDEYFPDDNDGSFTKSRTGFEFDDGGSGFGLHHSHAGRLHHDRRREKDSPIPLELAPASREGLLQQFHKPVQPGGRAAHSTPEPYTTQVQNQMDVEEWMHVFALERFVAIGTATAITGQEHVRL